MNEILISNGGAVTTLDDPSCTHFVSVFGLKRVKLRYNFALLDLVLIVLAFFDRSLIHLALAAACLKRCRANPSQWRSSGSGSPFKWTCVRTKNSTITRRLVLQRQPSEPITFLPMCRVLVQLFQTADVTSPRNGLLSPSTPGSRTRKRKRLKDTVSQLAAQGGSPVLLPVLPGSGKLKQFLIV